MDEDEVLEQFLIVSVFVFFSGEVTFARRLVWETMGSILGFFFLLFFSFSFDETATDHIKGIAWAILFLFLFPTYTRIGIFLGVDR
jgi:hypothetical protein